MITKLGKEKRSCADGRQKVEEDIQAAEDKCNHLSRVKGKLEQALDEAEDALEREKKVKGDVEKAKRKVEGDLKLTQEALADLERVKGELQGAAGQARGAGRGARRRARKPVQGREEPHHAEEGRLQHGHPGGAQQEARGRACPLEGGARG